MAKSSSSEIDAFTRLAMRSFAANVENPELEDPNLLNESEFLLDDNDTNVASPSTYADAPEENGDLILKETYDLPLGERIINKLLEFIGLPAAFAEEKEIIIKLTAKDNEELYNEEFDAEEEEEYLDEYFDDDVTPSQARKNFMSLSLSSALARKK